MSALETRARRIAARMAHIAPFEVMEIQTAARQLEAAGHDVIHMEIGEPDFATPEPIVNAAVRALREQRMNYTSALGLLPLREKIAAFYASRYGVKVAPERIVVTAGSSAGLLLTMGLLVNPGDEVVMADPGYPCNRHFVRVFDGVPLAVDAGVENGWQLTAAHVEACWTARTVAALIASPSNPTGTLVSPASMAQIHAAVKTRGGTLIVDEIYQGLTYGVPPATALSVADDVFVINSFSKYFQMTGWRLGWVVVPTAYVREIETLAQNLFISPSTPAQYAALAAFEPETLDILEARRVEFEARRDWLMPALADLGFGLPVVPHGAFYIYADCSDLAENSFALSRRILQEAHVAVTPGKDFGHAAPHRYLRIAYTNRIARLQEAVTRLGKLLK